ncbi:MAG: hypothetical protein XD95_0034 [Microgenomates bacterium 39_7]|nr:MAG: hypothetical protein XD95_0034 [Microgenomates bacterium 39_7]
MTRSPECPKTFPYPERVTTEKLVKLLQQGWNQVVYCCREGLTRSPGITTAHNKLYKPSNYPTATYLEGGLQTLINYYCRNHFGSTGEKHKEASKKLFPVLKSTQTFGVVVIENTELASEAVYALTGLNDDLIQRRGKVVLCPYSELYSHFGIKNGWIPEGTRCATAGRVKRR